MLIDSPKTEWRQTIIRNVDSQDTTSSVPEDVHPIRFFSGDSLYIIQNPEIKKTNNKPTSLIEFIQSRPDWERTLIENFQDDINVEPHFHFIPNNSELIIASA